NWRPIRPPPIWPGKTWRCWRPVPTSDEGRRNRWSVRPFQISGADFRPGKQFVPVTCHCDGTVHQHIAAMGKAKRLEGVLFDQQHGQAGVSVKVAYGAEN